MKKRFARITCAIVCLVLCALCFTACGDEKPKSEITESNWTAAFDSVLGESFSYAQEEGVSFIHIQHDSFKTEVIDTTESAKITKYYVADNGTYYIQERQGDFGTYTRRTVAITQLLAESKQYSDLPDTIVNGLKDKFSSFSFVEKNSYDGCEKFKAENLQLTDAGIAAEVEVYIIGNKIKEINIKGYTPANSESTLEVHLTGIGMTTVIVPEDFITDETDE